MSRRTMKALAEAIKNLPPNPTKFDVIHAIGTVCSRLNPRFDFGLFRAACGEG